MSEKEKKSTQKQNKGTDLVLPQGAKRRPVPGKVKIKGKKQK